MSAATVQEGIRITWTGPKPNDQAHVQLCENLMFRLAWDYGMDTVLIRRSIHETTRIGGKNGNSVPSAPHITADILNHTTGVGYALHYYVSLQTFSQLDVNPNPQLWPLEYQDGKWKYV